MRPFLLLAASTGRGPADCGSSEAWLWSRGAFQNPMTSAATLSAGSARYHE